MTPVGFEPTISAGERPKTYALDRAATGTGITHLYKRKICAAHHKEILIVLVPKTGTNLASYLNRVLYTPNEQKQRTY